jgi:hypothetical protein
MVWKHFLYWQKEKGRVLQALPRYSKLMEWYLFFLQQYLLFGPQEVTVHRDDEKVLKNSEL